jgi:FkbM family methyltransferase
MLRRQKWLWTLAGVPYRAVLRTLSGWRGIGRRVDGETFRWRYPFSEFDRDFERPVHATFCSLLRPGMTVLDIGASFGLYSVVAGRRVSDHGRVFAFEPLPTVATVLADHLALNNVADRVEVVPMVVTDTSGQIELWEPARDRLASISKLAATGRTEGTDGGPLRRHVVPATTIDEFCHVRRIEPDLIKIDVEGAEGSVLRGARRFLDRRQGQIILEVHPWALERFGEVSERLLAYLNAAGWSAIELYARGDRDNPAATVHYLCEPVCRPPR